MTDIMTANYNLSLLADKNMFTDTADILSWWNGAMDGIGLFVLLGVIGLVLFLAVRKFVDSDSEALSYSGFIVTFVGLMLFIIKDSAGDALLGWGYLSLIILVTAIATFLNFINRNM